MKYAKVQVRIPNLEGDGVAEIITIEVPVTIDPNTGEELLTEEAVEMIDNTKARHMGLLSPKEIKQLRERFGLTQKQMSELLQAGEKSYTRWESGKARPSRMVNVLLRALFEGDLTPETLKRIGGPRSKADRNPQPLPVFNWNEILDIGSVPSQWELFAQSVPVIPARMLASEFFEVNKATFVPKPSLSRAEDCAKTNADYRKKFVESSENDQSLA